jgi:4-amino-4-deoxy-L-arabinose transferase-like glycosyltransferase
MAEKTKTGGDANTAVPKLVWWMFGVAAVMAYLCGLGIPFVGPDEPRYAEVAREMFLRGDLITPTLGGFHWFEKPALLYWMEMAGYAVFGFHEFAARLGPMLCGLGTVAAVFAFGRVAAEDKQSQLPHWMALIAVSVLSIIVFSHGASFDIVLTFAVTASLASFFALEIRNLNQDGKGYKALALFYAFAGLGLLAKGLIGILFPYAVVAMFYALSRRWPSRRVWLSSIWGTVVAVAVASIWYVPMIVRHGREFVDEFFVQQQFERFTSNKYLHPQPFYFYLWVLPIMTLPWLPFFLGGVVQAVKNFATEVTEKGEGGRVPEAHAASMAGRFALAWVIVPLVFFSLSGSKLPGYILPSVPPAAVLAGLCIWPLVRRSRGWRTGLLAAAGTTIAAAIVLIIFAAPGFADAESVKRLIETANEKGYSDTKVLSLHTVSQSAEFYAAGRLALDLRGKQLRLEGVQEIVHEMEGRRAVLVLVPVKYVSQLTSYDGFRTEVLADNSELAIAAVTPN